MTLKKTSAVIAAATILTTAYHARYHSQDSVVATSNIVVTGAQNVGTSYDSYLGGIDTSTIVAPSESVAVNTESNSSLSDVLSAPEPFTSDPGHKVVIDSEDTTVPGAATPFVSEFANPHFEIGEYCSLPDLPTNVKACTDYRCYGLTNTPHWRLQQRAWTDEWGLRRFNNDYIVGLGTYYSTDIGDRFEVTLETGRVFTIILGDNKADIHTDPTNRYKPCAYYTDNDANVLEFIMDKYAMPDWVYARGSIDCIDEFAGNITSIKYLGRDASGDWDSYV